MPIKKLPPKELRKHKGVSFVGVATVFFCHDGKGKFLMAKRSQNTRDEQGRWENPAGGLKWGVKAVDNIKRELKEELGVTAQRIELMGYRDVFRKLDDGTPTHWLMLDYAVKVNPAQVRIMEPDLCDEIGWFTLDNQPEPQHSQNSTFMKKYREQIAKLLDAKP